MLNGVSAAGPTADPVAGPAAGPDAGHRVAGPPTPEACPAGFTGLVPIGRGSQGQVFRATKSSIGKVVALKAFPLATPGLGPPAAREKQDLGPLGTSSRIHEQALHAEVRALVALSQHPGVVDVHDLHISGDRAWLEMDYCGGGSAGAWAARLRIHGAGERPAALSALLRLGGQVAEALHFAHEQGWVHGDVKPSNILLDDRGAARLCDFGLARLSAAANAEVTGRRAPGTPRFQPPEVAGGAVPTAAADVYALAETLRDLRNAIFAESTTVVAGSSDPDVTDTGAFGTSCADILTDLDVLLAHMSDPDPGIRPRAAEVAERLAALGDRLTSGMEGPSTQARTPRHQPGAGTRPTGLTGPDGPPGPAGTGLLAPAPAPSHSPSAAPSPRSAAADRRSRGIRVTVTTAATVAVVLLLVGVTSQIRRWSDESRAADPTVAPPAQTPSPASSPATGPAGPTPDASPSPTSNPPRQTDPPATPTALAPPSAGPAPSGAVPAAPAPRGGTATTPVPSPSTQVPRNQAPTTTVTYRFPPGTPSPQFRDGTCVYRIWYGNYGDTPFAKVRFYSGDCGSVAVAVVAQRGSTTSYYGNTGTSAGTDSCGTYIEMQADGRGATATAVGETLYFPETGHGYEFMSGAGQPPAAFRSC